MNMIISGCRCGHGFSDHKFHPNGRCTVKGCPCLSFTRGDPLKMDPNISQYIPLDYDFVTDRLGVGTTPNNPSDVQKLADAGFTHIINCRGELDIYDLLKTTVFAQTYLWDGTVDYIPGGNQHKGVEWFQAGIEFALRVLCKPHGRIYVFCAAGANRSATLAWTILRALGMTSGECFAALDSHRFIDIPGLLLCGWWRDGNDAVKQLGYV